MKATHLLAVGLAALAAGLGATATATAEQPFERCPADFDATARIYHYDNPPRTDAHLVEIGTATNLANGKTLTRTARYTEIASGPIVFTDHGVTRYSLPDGGTVTVRAGFTQESEVPPLPEVFHGNPFDDADVAAFCAALS